MFAEFRFKFLRPAFWTLVVLLSLALVLAIIRDRQGHTNPLDFDGDGIFEQIILDNGVFQIWKQNRLIFASDPQWQVTGYVFGDSNNDGFSELNLGFWRTGDYGPQNPYAKKRRDPLPGYHLYLYRYLPDTENFRLLWGSSTLNDPLYFFEVTRSTDNSINYLSVETGSYADYDKYGSIIPLETSTWVWNDWWFKKLDQ